MRRCSYKKVPRVSSQLIRAASLFYSEGFGSSEPRVWGFRRGGESFKNKPIFWKLLNLGYGGLPRQFKPSTL